MSLREIGEQFGRMEKALRLEGGRPRAASEGVKADLPRGWSSWWPRDLAAYTTPVWTVERVHDRSRGSVWEIREGGVFIGTEPTALEAIEWVEKQRNAGGD